MLNLTIRDNANPSGNEMACLRQCARAPMVNLHDQLLAPCVKVVLADKSGDILDSVGDGSAGIGPREQWPHPLKPSHELITANSCSLNTRRSAPSAGTSSDITSDRASVFAIATPINAASGGLIGIIDRSHSRGTGLQHLKAMLQFTADSIERRVIGCDTRGFLLIRFHPRPELLNSPFDAITLFNENSRVIGYNKLAANLLSLDQNGFLAHCADCFDTQWSGLVGYAALSKPEPLRLRTREGSIVSAVVNLR